MNDILKRYRKQRGIADRFNTNKDSYYDVILDNRKKIYNNYKKDNWDLLIKEKVIKEIEKSLKGLF